MWILPKTHQLSSAFALDMNWPTPTSRDHKGGANLENRQRDGNPRKESDMTLPDAILNGGRPDQENNNTHGNRQELWATPASAGVTGGLVGLGWGSGNRKKMYKLMGDEDGKAMCCGKLNPDWVETLMGLPVGPRK